MSKTETVYKLTDTNDETRGHTKWGKGVKHTARGGKEALCTGAWLHAYRDPYIAMMLNPGHADFNHPHLWEAEAIVGKDEGDKIGCTEITTVRRIRKPRVSDKMRRKFAVLVALEVYELWQEHDKNGVWKSWADDIIAGKKTTDAARAAGARDAHKAKKDIDIIAIAHKACGVSE